MYKGKDSKKEDLYSESCIITHIKYALERD